MKKRNILMLVIVLMAVGFAALSTALYINGQIEVAVNENDFDVYFSKTYENEIENNSLIVDKTHISFSSNLSNIGEKYELGYVVTNGSKNYDAEVSINCSKGNEYLSVNNIFDDTKDLKSGENREGTLTAQVIKSVTEETQINITCEINVNAVSRTELGVEPVEYNREIYGVRRSRESSETTWERIGSSIGLVANATHDGSAVQNDFDNIYPWSEIITYNYDDVTKQETAVLGDDNFKFDGSNGQVLTRIPEFWYKREVKDGYEYIYISKEARPGYTKSEAFSVGRYTMSGNSSKVYSKSGVAPIINTTITNFRNYARNLGEDFGQLDYHYFILQLLYLVEYADYNSQAMLGLGNVNNSGKIASGGCNSLGMKSGTLVNDGKHSVIYRGIEDIFGNIWQYVDGINIQDHVAYINYNPDSYQVDKFDGDYRPLGYLNSMINAYTIVLGCDSNHPLVSLPIAVGGKENMYIGDSYLQNPGNRLALVGGAWYDSFNAGLWYWNLENNSSVSWTGIGARLVRYQ